MSNRTITVTDQLYDYMLSVSLQEPKVLKNLRKETAKLAQSDCQIAPEQGQFMHMLLKLIGARRTLELGVFTGYSALWTAMALPEDGKMVACDINEEWTRLAERYWKKAKVSDKIDLHLAPAGDTLDRLIKEGGESTFDFAFIDADKDKIVEYYEQCLKLIRPGGLIAIDNVFMGNAVLDEEINDPHTEAVRLLNKNLVDDDRVEISLVPIADGLTLARKL